MTRTSMNKRTHFFIKIYLPHFILERVDVGCVWEMSWRQGQTVILTQRSSDHSSTSSSSWLDCLTVGHWGPIAYRLPLALISASCLQLTQAVCVWLYYSLTYTCFRWSVQPRKWTRLPRFKRWTRLITFHFTSIHLESNWIQLFPVMKK